MLTLLHDPIFYTLAVAVGGGLFALLRQYIERRIQSGVDARFALKLESHKHELQLVAEATKFDFQRRLTDVSQYAAKKHAASAEVYAALRYAHGTALNLRGIRQELTFEEFNSEDLAAHMSSRDVPQGMQARILTRLGSDRPGAIKEMKEYLRIMTFQDAERKFHAARNAALLNDLYFSDAVVEAINAFLDLLADWFSWIQAPRLPGDKSSGPTKQAINAAIERVHDLMRADLSAEEPRASAVAPAV